MIYPVSLKGSDHSYILITINLESGEDNATLVYDIQQSNILPKYLISYKNLPSMHLISGELDIMNVITETICQTHWVLEHDL